ncbi:TRAP transporter permease [Ammoniphilus sp. CFH 90114]|uniref:TRAP transporter permease n=1 Tax=Ammoniphilus sp. CFH 90114 TaxID=2493665 RepID=UPI00100E9A51|nr:TRAP transporter permease [Ammoniphilus sp. CFH 90114]RXT07219.1 TRAP transporter permease [Ammoniphilus sp. CFH 90114]
MRPNDISVEQQEEIIKKYDNESNYREFRQGFWRYVVFALAVGLSLFHLYTAGFGQLLAIKQRAIHLGLVLMMVFLIYPMRKKSNQNAPTIPDMALSLLSMIGIGYLIVFNDDIAMRAGMSNQTDIIFGTITILLVLEATRRTMGNTLPIIAIIFLVYAKYGEWIPGAFAHMDFSYGRIIEQMYLSTEGIFGIALGVSATYIFLFVLFGAFMTKTGMGKLITDASISVAGTTPGGPAKVAMVGSCVMGTVNGAAVANVVTTGAFTIPMMKRIGYSPTFAGAVETVASSGGQIMPPVMGAAAFVLAELTGIPYSTVMIAAIIPAFLYYLAAWVMVDREARRLNLKGLDKSEIPRFLDVVKERGHMILPLFVVTLLLLNGYSPIYAAFFGIISTVAIGMLRKTTRLNGKELLEAMEQGGKTALSVAVACAVVGFIVGSVSLTSAGVTFTSSILQFTEGHVFFTLFLTMIACIILGMGLPTTAAYIMASIIAVPALIELGINVLASHLFVFYFATLSTLTPPVAIAAYAAAGLAKASPFKVGWTSVRLALAGFIIPFMFAYEPSLLIVEGTLSKGIIGVLAAILGVILLGCAVIGYFRISCTWLERLLLFAGAVALILPENLTDIMGLLIGVIVFMMQQRRISRVANKKEVNRMEQPIREGL